MRGMGPNRKLLGQNLAEFFGSRLPLKLGTSGPQNGGKVEEPPLALPYSLAREVGKCPNSLSLEFLATSPDHLSLFFPCSPPCLSLWQSTGFGLSLFWAPQVRHGVLKWVSSLHLRGLLEWI